MKSHAQQVDLVDYCVALGRDLGLPERDIQTVRQRSCSEGWSFLTRTLPLLAKALERGLADKIFKLPSNFRKVTRSSELPAFCGSLFRRIFYPTGGLRDNFCPYSVYVLRQFLYAVNKVNLPYTESQEKSVIEGFVETEKIVQQINREGFDSRLDGLFSIASECSKEVFGDFDPNGIVPRNGPGIVSNSDRYQKNDKRLAPGLPAYHKYANTYWFNAEDAFTRLWRYPVYGHLDLFKTQSMARVILVPKDSRGPRLISCEPQENQWVQQGIMDYMVRKLESHPLTRGQINFTDQSVNQRMAHVASKTMEWSTLDLKDASDRVSLALVSKIFGRSAIFSSLLETRTPQTMLPDGRILPLGKFAPMGSALCFPVMASCIYMVLYAGFILSGEAPDDARSQIFVYGDDIIVPSRLAKLSITLLELVGLLVNKQKSFVNSTFAESCGRDYVMGNDVTPIRLRQCLNVEEARTLLSLQATAHQLSQAGLSETAEYLYTLLESFLGPLPWGSHRSPYVCRLILTNQANIPEANAYRKGLKWVKSPAHLQEPLGTRLKAWTWTSEETQQSESEWAHLMRTWNLLGRFDPDNPIPSLGVFSRPRSLRLKRRSFNHYAMA